MSWIRTIPSGPFQTNAYLCGSDEGTEVLLIDAPPGALKPVQEALAESSRKLTALIITHPHFDHTLDAPVFSNSGITVYAHPEAIDGIQHPQTLGLIPEPAGGFPSCGDIVTLPIGESLKLAGLDFMVFDVPGHSNGSVALYTDGHCFVGDVIFRGSVGRTDLPGGDFDTLAESIQNRLYTLPEDTLLYPGHGPISSVGEEKRSNPFVRG